MVEASASAATVKDPVSVQRNLTSSQIRSHLAVAEHGSFRAAAHALEIAEPTLHRAARDLERVVGARLYHRTPQGMAATAAGLAFASRLRLMLYEVDQALDELAAEHDITGGRVSAGCLPLMPKPLLARTVGRLLRAYPTVRVELQEASHGTLMAGLRGGDIDMMVGALRQSQLPGDVVERALFSDPHVMVVRVGHPLAGLGGGQRGGPGALSLGGAGAQHPAPRLRRRPVRPPARAAANRGRNQLSGGDDGALDGKRLSDPDVAGPGDPRVRLHRRHHPAGGAARRRADRGRHHAPQLAAHGGAAPLPDPAAPGVPQHRPGAAAPAVGRCLRRRIITSSPSPSIHPLAGDNVPPIKARHFQHESPGKISLTPLRGKGRGWGARVQDMALLSQFPPPVYPHP